MKPAQIYPGGVPKSSNDIGRKKPEPPKFIVNADGTMTRVSATAGPNKLNYIREEDKPVPARISQSYPDKN